MALTELQSRFVGEYLKDLNATQAYIRAGYRARGHSAEVNAGRLLRNAAVAAEVAEKLQERCIATQIDAEYVLTELQVQYRNAANDDDRKNALRALDLMGKHVDVGAFKERVQVEGNLDLNLAVSFTNKK